MIKQETNFPQVASFAQSSTEKRPWTKPTLTEINLGEAEQRRPQRKPHDNVEHVDHFGFISIHVGPNS
jgi:hypothetical protein